MDLARLPHYQLFNGLYIYIFVGKPIMALIAYITLLNKIADFK